ncbi:MAG TPA: MarR family transcriptional regulator [Desulfomonilia bacterium]|nr:MarR family transcriptional regulator [Desulfomonilia bacterium]
MTQKILRQDRQILSLMTELAKALRCCRQDEVFCEDVTFTQFIILDTVARNHTLNMASLHDALSVDKSTTTRLVAPLIKRNLVIRDRADHDSRAATLKLTEEGSEVHEKVWQCLLSFIRAVQDGIPAEKRAGVIEGVGLFLSSVRNVSALRCGADAKSGGCKCSAIN